MYLKAMKALRSNLKDRSELLMKHKKLKRNSGTFGRKLLTKVNWTKDSKKEIYYHSLKPEVKDEIYKTDR
ncbi:hypothetical protein MKX08_003199 [Trichoderma sp. CBMAI-0020]|nr:hypothetical protein MKX08_003199 [Trichoderma sp. CBMAI-0020]